MYVYLFPISKYLLFSAFSKRINFLYNSQSYCRIKCRRKAHKKIIWKKFQFLLYILILTKIFFTCLTQINDFKKTVLVLLNNVPCFIFYY